MPNILTIAYAVEGTTDVRFLHNIIQRTFEEIAFGCDGDVDVYEPIHIPTPKKGSFNDSLLEIAQEANKCGINVLCVHTDADAGTDKDSFDNKINPGFKAVYDSEMKLCKNLVAIVPVHMSEAWMIADRNLLKEEIGTNKSHADLGIARAPEDIADPKQVLTDAIRIGLSDKPKKLRNITIAELYQPLGQKISLDTLGNLPSYRKFRISVELSFRRLNYLK